MTHAITLQEILVQTKFRAKSGDPLIQRINELLNVGMTPEDLNKTLDIASERNLRAVDIKKLMEKKHPSLCRKPGNWSTQILGLITDRLEEVSADTVTSHQTDNKEEQAQSAGLTNNGGAKPIINTLGTLQLTKKVGQGTPIRNAIDIYKEYKLNPHLRDRTKILSDMVLLKLREAMSGTVTSDYQDLSGLGQTIDSFDGDKDLIASIDRKLRRTNYIFEFEKLFDVLQMLNDNLFAENGLIFTTTEERDLQPARLIDSITPAELIGRQRINLPNGSSIPVYLCTRISNSFSTGYHPAGMILINIDSVDTVSQMLYEPKITNQSLSGFFLANVERIRQLALQRLPEQRELLAAYVHDYIVEEIEHVIDIEKDRRISSRYRRSKYDRSDFVVNVFEPQFAGFFNGIITSLDQQIRKELISVFMEFTGAMARIAMSREPSLAVYHLLAPSLIGETSYHSISGNLAIYFANRGANPSRFEISNTDVLKLFQALPDRELETVTNNLLTGKSSVVNKGAIFALNKMLDGGFNTFAHKRIVF